MKCSVPKGLGFTFQCTSYDNITELWSSKILLLLLHRLQFIITISPLSLLSVLLFLFYQRIFFLN